MLSKYFRSSSLPFAAPLWSSFIIGSTLAICFYATITNTPLTHPLLNRYALCHLVAVVSVVLFLIAIVSIIQKLIFAFKQQKLTTRAVHALADLSKSAANTSPLDNATWLSTLWKAQTTQVCQSWIGLRIADVLSRQISRGSCRMLEDDLHDTADKDANHQHESYGLVRMMTLAILLLGFLGTVIGIAETLGQVDTKSLLGGSQEAMDSLQAGLYVAFDSTVVGLVLTMASMFVIYGVNRFELSLLSTIDNNVALHLRGLMSIQDDSSKDLFRVEKTVRHLTDQFLIALDRVVQTQADLWKESMLEAQYRWSNLAKSASHTIETSLTTSLSKSLDKHSADLERTQSEGVIQIDTRYQQWQTTLSEQARTIHSQQNQVLETTGLLRELIDKCDAFKMLEENLQQNLTHLTDVDRFHEAAICLTEAVAVLGTQMERSGFIGKQAIRRSTNVAPGTDSLPIRKAA